MFSMTFFGISTLHFVNIQNYYHKIVLIPFKLLLHNNPTNCNKTKNSLLDFIHDVFLNNFAIVLQRFSYVKMTADLSLYDC